MEEQQQKPAALAMPATAEIVADLRAWLGRERVDAAIKAGQVARREFARLQAAHGEAHAQAWLARQRFPAGVFWASEGGREVGAQRT